MSTLEANLEAVEAVETQKKTKNTKKNFIKSCILPQCARAKIEVTALNGLELRS